MSHRTVRTIATLLLGAGVVLAVENLQPMEKHYEAARVALSKGDTNKAKQELKLSLQEDPLHAEAHFLLASLLGREGDLDQAAVAYQETVKLEPNNAVARYNLGTTMLRRGETLPAARLLEEAAAIRPDYVPAYNNLAKAYFLAGLPELSVASYQETLRRDPANPIARKGLTLLTQAGGAQTGSGSTAAEPQSPANHRSSVVPAQAAPQPEPGDAEAHALREQVRDLPHVTAERRGDRLAVAGWTSGPGERKLLDRLLVGRTNILDLTTDDAGDPQRLLEVDAIIFYVLGLDSKSLGHDFLRRITVNASVADAATAGFGWLYNAAISYEVNIANATQERVAFLARPHLTTLSGSPATFIAGGDTVYKVSGTTSGDIKAYPFGTSLEVTPTLLRTPGGDGGPRVRLVVKAGRKSILSLESPEVQSTGSSVYANIAVTSEAVLDLNQTLILTGLSQREQTVSRSGVPVLKSIPILKYLFSEEKTLTKDFSIIILLTPREPAFWDEQNHRALAEFVAKRRAYVQATHGTPDDMQRFKERYPDWSKLAPNRFASHFFLMENSEIYRRVSGADLGNEALDFDILGKTPKNKAKL
jgi:tetratricopeptide (TPR) repeat protein